MAPDAVRTLFTADMSGLICVTYEALMIVRVGRVALRVGVGLMTRGACNIAFQETGALHEAQRLETHIGDVALIAGRRLQPVACPA